MCSNYVPAKHEQLILHFGVTLQFTELKPEAYPGFLAPIIRHSRDESKQELECLAACFGMVPHWADFSLAKRTYNARSETVSTKPSFRSAWRKRQFCIIPAHSFFEPSWETGKAIRWEISHAAGRPMGIAGIYEWRPDGPDGDELFSFSMLTINADEHPLMKRFHRPDDEKRMVVIIEPPQYEDWINASLEEVKDFLIPYPAEQLIAQPAPKPPSSRSKSRRLSDAA